MPIEVRKIVGIVEDGEVVRGYVTEHELDGDGQEVRSPRDVELTPDQLAALNAADVLGVG